MMRDGGDVWRRAFLDGLRPEPLVSVTEWADAHRILPASTTNEAGRYDTNRTPFWREPMDCMSIASPVEKVVVLAPSQSGKTEIVLNWMGYVMDHAPGPTMYVSPTEEFARLISRSRIDPMIQACPRLRMRVSERRERDGANSTLYKEFPGGSLRLVGTNTPVGLKSSPIRYLAGDEIDEWVGDVGGQGDPLYLALVRTTTYRHNRKVLLVSSPTIEGRSRIAAEYEETDQRVFMVPCTSCGTLQEISWRDSIRWRDHPKTGQPDPATVHMRCSACPAEIPDWHKAKMLAGGVWMPRRLDADPAVRGYWLSGVYSPFISWGQALEDFLRAKKRPAALKVFVNTYLAETWRQLGDAPAWKPLFDRREAYKRGTVPRGGLVLTMAVDVQGDRLELEVVAWGRGLETWSIDHVTLAGRPSDPDVWLDLQREMTRTFPHDSGVEMSIRAVGIDTGGADTSAVYRWIRKQPIGRVFALKGTDDSSAIIVDTRAVEVQHQAKRLARGLRLWKVGTWFAKTELYGWLRLERPDDPTAPLPPGYCHFPEYPKAYFRGLTAEQFVRHEKKDGFVKWAWEKPAGERNEPLDLRVYNRAVAAIIGLDRYPEAKWAALEANLGVMTSAPAPSGKNPGATPGGLRPARPPGSGGYIDRGGRDRSW